MGTYWYADMPLTEIILDEKSFASLPFRMIDNTKRRSGEAMGPEFKLPPANKEDLLKVTKEMEAELIDFTIYWGADRENQNVVEVDQEKLLAKLPFIP